MTLTVYAFNDSYPLYLHLMGLRSFFSSPEWTSMVFLTVSLVTLIGVLTVQQRSLLGYGKAYAMPVLLYALLFIPTARLQIEDQWSRDAYSVDKVPVALALPLAATTILEKNIVDLVDKHIVPANVPSFAQFDFFLEAMALGEVLNGKTIHNYETLSSVGRYFDDCVLKGIATGFVNESAYYRSGKLLIDSYMPWSIYFTEVIHPDGCKEVMTCKMAYNRLFGSVAGEANSVGPAGMAAYLSNLFGGRHQSIADTLTAMNGLANAMFPGHQATSEALFQQAFMINGLQSSLTKSNPQLLAAISQAEVAQSTGITAAASVYIKKLPKLRAMIKLSIIGLLPLVGGFFLAQCGRPLLHWALALLSVSLWLPIMAIIKGSYISSAISELHGMVLATGGMTLPNKLRLMSWITDTSTTAATLAFAIPVITATVLQILAPRLALFAGSIAGMTRGMDGFSQRSGMQALQGAERSARELEMDKVNAAFLEAGDSHLFRNQRMNELTGAHHNVAFARNTGTSPLQYNGTNTSAVQGQGYTISGGLDRRSSHIAQEAVASQQAKLTSAQASAAYSLATGTGTNRSTSDFDRWENSLDKNEQKQLSDVRQSIGGMTESVAKSQGWSAEEKAMVDRTLAAGVYAGVDLHGDKQFKGKFLKFFTGLSVRAGAEGRFGASVTTGESERQTHSAQSLLNAVMSNSDISSYAQNRSLAIGESHKYGTGEEWRDSESKQESFQNSMQRVDSAWQSLSATQTAIEQQQSSLSATGGRSINTGDLVAVTSRGDLELMAHNEGMTRLRGAFDRGVNNIDDLRIAANADLFSLLRAADSSNTASLDAAMHSLDVIANSSQYNAHDAAIGMQILTDRANLASLATNSGLPSFGGASSSAAGSFNAHMGGIEAGEAKLAGVSVNRDVLPHPVGKGASSQPVQPPVVSAPEPMGRAEAVLKAGIGAMFGPAAPAVQQVIGGLFGGSSGTGSSKGGSTTAASTPQGGLDNPDSARALGRDMERSADGDRERIQRTMQGQQRDVLDNGKQDVAGVSGLDPNRGTLVNSVLVFTGGDENSGMAGQLAQSAKEYGLGDAEPKGREFSPGTDSTIGGNASIAPAPQGGLDNPDSTRALGRDMERSAGHERVQIPTQGQQRDVLDSGKQNVAGVSRLDPSRGTRINTDLILKGEDDEIIEQLPPNAKKHGFGHAEPKEHKLSLGVGSSVNGNPATAPTPQGGLDNPDSARQNMERNAANDRERIQGAMQSQQRDVLDNARQDEANVSERDPHPGTRVNSLSGLAGGDGDAGVAGQLTQSAKERGFVDDAPKRR